MSEDKSTQTRSHLPHRELLGSTYFITFRVRSGRMNQYEQKLVLEHINSGDGLFYLLVACVVMPDHVHLIVRPNDGYHLSRVMKGIKGVSANLINKTRSGQGAFWQDEYHDRILRSEKEVIEKARYLLENPIRAGLIKSGEVYPFVIENFAREA